MYYIYIVFSIVKYNITNIAQYITDLLYYNTIAQCTIYTQYIGIYKQRHIDIIILI